MERKKIELRNASATIGTVYPPIPLETDSFESSMATNHLILGAGAAGQRKGG